MRNVCRLAAGAIAVLVAVGGTPDARATEPFVRDGAFITCAEANAMPAAQRKTLGLKIAEAAALYYQTQLADSEAIGEQIGWLVRSACTIAPEGYFSTAVARAVRVMGGGVEPPLRQPLDMKQAVFVSCAGANALPRDQLKQLGSFISAEAAAHYQLSPGPEWTPDYVAALVHNGCRMYPDAYYLGMIGRAIRAVSAPAQTAASSIPEVR